jgi:hypothetical protein
MVKKLWLPLVALVLVVSILLVSVCEARAASSPSRAAAGATPGVAAAEALSTITGVAISPLLGVSGVGAWTYFKTPAAQRADLPWYAQPWFWLPALLLVGAVAAKDVLGAAVPPGLKKPFDVAELFENKLSALVAAGAFVPLIATIFSSAASSGGGPQAGLFGGTMLAAFDASTLYTILLFPFALAAFVVVWIVSHVINVLILISPWGGVDAVLKGFRTFLLGTVAVTGFFSPKVGAIWALIIILLCLPLAGWAFRLATFGTIFGWDFFTLGRKRCRPSAEGNLAFTARRIDKTPIRSCGKLRLADGKLQFTYRPWLVLAPRTIELPAGAYAVGRGLFYPNFLSVQDEKARTMLNFPPRYRTHEQELGRLYGAPVQDVGLLKGFKAAWRWLKEIFGVGKTRVDSAEPVGMVPSHG